MKTPRVGMETRRHTPTFETGPGDAYRLDRKLAEPVTCPQCHATYHHGHWHWGKAAPGTALVTCPACERIADDYPGGWVTLKGEYYADHREEILARVRECEAHEKAEHPLQRIIALNGGMRSATVTTTDPHLAHIIGEAVGSAFKGKLVLNYTRGENRLRATWER